MEALPLIIQINELPENGQDSNVVLVAVCSESTFAAGHIPGSVLVTPDRLTKGEKPAVGKLPSEESLSALFSEIGLTEDTHLVIYDDEGGGWAGRLIWTLDVIGHDKYSYIDGGLVAWKEAGLPLSIEPPQAKPSVYTVAIDNSVLVTLDEVTAQIKDPRSIVWDARSIEEYTGVKNTALRNGHIPNAVNLDWLDLMDKENGLRLKSLEDIRDELTALGIDSSKSVITHCQTHHRSGLTYLVGKALGLSIKAYDGSWSEWGNHPDTAIET